MKIIARSEIHYEVGKCAAPGTLVEVKDETAVALIEGGYADRYEEPKTVVEAKREKAGKGAGKSEGEKGEKGAEGGEL